MSFQNNSMKIPFYNVKTGGQFTYKGECLRKTSVVGARIIHADKRRWLWPWSMVDVCKPLPVYQQPCPSLRVITYNGLIVGDPDLGLMQMRCISSPSYLKGLRVIYVGDEEKDSRIYDLAIRNMKECLGEDYKNNSYWQLAHDEC